MDENKPNNARKSKSDRRIPGWAAGILTRFARDRPAVVTRYDIAEALAEADLDRDVDATAHELQRLGWLISVHLKGVWAYLPAGEDEVSDPYIDLRAWRARDKEAVFALAGEAAAWHLGYLDRSFDGATAVWIPEDTRPPHGLRPHVSVVTLGWTAPDAPRLVPSVQFLHRRRLDLTGWATGLPGFGPEALVVQLSRRPGSFRVWGDLIPHLVQLAEDCDMSHLTELLHNQSMSAWQRAAYLLSRGDRLDDGMHLLANGPTKTLPKVQFGNAGQSVWVPQFNVLDRLIAPLQQSLGKA
ncbi:MAG: type IV toxin-antitoxin system AbiEi family antitoxin [Acidimicrobiales bacterium]